MTGKIAASSIDMIDANDYKNYAIENFQSLPEVLKDNPNNLDKYLPPFPDEMFDKFNTIPFHSNIVGQKTKSTVKDLIKDGELKYDKDDFKNHPLKLTLTKDTRFTLFKISGNSTVELDIGSNDINLFIDKLDLSGHIKVIGTGNLNIYVKEKIDFTSKSTINLDGSPSAVNIYYAGKDKLDFYSDAKLFGSLYVKMSKIEFSGGAYLAGNIYSHGTEKIDFKMGSPLEGQWIVAPYAEIEMSTAYHDSAIRGIVIANKVDLSTHGTIIYSGDTLVPNPMVPSTPSKKTFNPDSSPSSYEEILIEVDKH